MADKNLTEVRPDGVEITYYDADGVPCPKDRAVMAHMVLPPVGDETEPTRLWLDMTLDDEGKGVAVDDR